MLFFGFFFRSFGSKYFFEVFSPCHPLEPSTAANHHRQQPLMDSTAANHHSGWWMLVFGGISGEGSSGCQWWLAVMGGSSGCQR